MNKKLKKIVVSLNEDEKPDENITAETIWAKNTKSNNFVLENSLFYKYGLSYNDLVECSLDKDGRYYFKDVIKKGGYSTIRVLLKNPLIFNEFAQSLNKLNIFYEAYSDKYYVFEIPPNVDFETAKKIFSKYYKSEDIEYEISNLEHEI